MFHGETESLDGYLTTKKFLGEIVTIYMFL